MSEWYQKSAEEVLKELGSSRDQGLTGPEAARRLAEQGPNALEEKKARNVLKIIFDQFTSLMILILLGAALISAALGDVKDAVVILAIVILNAVLGFVQEYRAEKAMEALKKLSVPAVRVQRDGKLTEVPARDLVTGDLVFLEAGNLVPADGRLLEVSNLRVQEASLTGESESVEKRTEAMAASAQSLGDRHNVVYMGTVVTYGRGLMTVTACGMKTELGSVARMIQSVVSGPTPLQKRLDQLSKALAGAALAIVAVIFFLGMLRGEELRLMFMTAVSLAVAAVPEGLPAVVTISLALGAHRMLKRKALIRKLSAVETLGSVTVICSDKTGTLTQNRMTVCVLDAADHRLDYVIDETPGTVEPSRDLHPSFALMLTAAALCNDASQESSSGGEKGKSFGDPTETALVAAARHFGFEKRALEKVFPRVLEIPFDSERKMMTTAHVWPAAGQRRLAGFELAPGLPEGDRVLFTKGALDSLLKVSSSVWTDDGIRPLDDTWKKRIWTAHDGLAASGKRVLGTGLRILTEASGMEKVPESDLCFAGLIGMIDPPREEARDAVQLCLSAGIRPVMITGDHPLTAAEIAGQLGIDKTSGVVTGQELEALEEKEFSAKAARVSVFARVSPAHKLQIVEALQKQGSIVAMTGDGVNDAPALKKADIGVAMGITGTDVSKEAASMVLMDDNFATIVAAVREGRAIYDNIRKFIRYLLATNASEILVMLAAPFLGMPLPLLPLQILWINLVTDGFPALALAFEPAEENIMKRKPHPPGESIFARGLGRHVVMMGCLMAALSLGAGAVYWRSNAEHWQTMVFMVIAMTQMGHVMAIRSENGYALKINPFSNKPLFASLWIVIAAQLAVVYVPQLQQIFNTQALPLPDLLLCFGSGVLVFLTVEAEKFLTARFRQRKTGEAS